MAPSPRSASSAWLASRYGSAPAASLRSTAPAGTRRRPAAAVRAVSGEGAKVVRTADDQRSHDLAPILVATDGALDALGYDRRRFRPNIVLEGVEGVAEREWLGKKLTIGDVVLIVTQPCERCGMTIIHPDTLEIDPDVLRRVKSELGGVMGMYCKVERPGRIAVGDDVTIE